MANLHTPPGFCKNFLNRFLIIIKGYHFAIEPPTRVEGVVLNDGAKMKSNMSRSFLIAMN